MNSIEEWPVDHLRPYALRLIDQSYRAMSAAGFADMPASADREIALEELIIIIMIAEKQFGQFRLSVGPDEWQSLRVDGQSCEEVRTHLARVLSRLTYLQVEQERAKRART
jgi:hypothetical protein